MNNLIPSKKIYVSQSKIVNGGRGVFASELIESGEIIERCPFIEIDNLGFEFIENTILFSYVYFFGKTKKRILIALGFGSIYNHSYKPNAKYIIKPKEKIIEFRSILEIKKDDEILVNYNQESNDAKPLWFED